MHLLIHDASVLIDLIDIGLLDTAFRLPYEMVTPDLVQVEILDPNQSKALDNCVEAKLVSIIPSTTQQVQVIMGYKAEYKQLTMADCSVVFHALDKKGVVISADKNLRTIAERKHLEVHGSLWILDQLVQYELLSAIDAAIKLAELRKLNSRLPEKECVRLIDSWRQR